MKGGGEMWHMQHKAQLGRIKSVKAMISGATVTFTSLMRCKLYDEYW